MLNHFDDLTAIGWTAVGSMWNAMATDKDGYEGESEFHFAHPASNLLIRTCPVTSDRGPVR